MMVDFITAVVPARLPFPITDGAVVDHDADGVVRFSFAKRRTFFGSYDATITIRAVTLEEIEISGNPAKFLQGHNLYGPACPRELLRRVLEIVLPSIYGTMPYIYLNGATFSRIDLTDGFLLERANDVALYLRALYDTAHIAYKGRGHLDGSTLVFGRVEKGKRAKAWQLVLYHKGAEVMKRPLPPCMMEDVEVMDWASRLLRVELRLRGRELKELGVATLLDWEAKGPLVAETIWLKYVKKLNLSEVREMKTSELEHLKPRLAHAYAAWRHGEDLSKGMKPMTFFRLRRDLKNLTGADIAIPVPRSNVVPVLRVISTIPAHRPRWADRVDKMLAA